MFIEVLVLLVIFQLKHLIADYYLQYLYMYENKGKAEKWFKPHLDHALIHATFTLAILTLFGSVFFPEANKYQIALVLGGATLFDLATHFLIDRWKATRDRHPGQSEFWADLGIDQRIHHLVGILIVFTTIYIVTP